MPISNAYNQIKQFLNETDFDAVLVSRTDSFLGEYYPPEACRLEVVTGGFSGSAGLALITKDEDVLFVDSRYTIQAKNQTRFRVFEVPAETTPSQWMKANLDGLKIGFNPKTHSIAWYEQMESVFAQTQTQIEPLDVSLFDKWFDTTDFKSETIFDYDLKYAGISSEIKCQNVARQLAKDNIDVLVVVSPENVSWLLNKRSKTVPEYPVVFEQGMIDRTGLYVPLDNHSIQSLVGKRVGMDLTDTSVALYHQIKSVAAEVVKITDPINEMKAVKNDIEILNIKQACLSESVVMCRFLAWVEQNKNRADEMMCDEKLIELRREIPDYFADSFSTIAAVGEHAARAHYRADSESNAALVNAPLLLVDTGGHYMRGTTDMTRTIAVSDPTPIMKKRYTQVLQGHIDLSESSIKIGETTAELDRKAHAWLRADGVDYYHGTSHGIGMMLAVHENPPVVHERDTYGIRAGMVFSNEPAFYSETDGYGIRLETMLLSVAQDNDTLIFENLLLIPFDPRLVEFDLLTDTQKQWLKSYHTRIETIVFPLLNETEREILLPFVQAFQNRM